MTDSEKARRAIVPIGSIEVEGFQLPNGFYRMSQTQASDCIGDDRVYARRFLTSKTLKALRGEAYTPDTFEVESPDEQVRGQTRIQGWPLEIVYAYWVYRCFRGNKAAFNMVIALGTESLERRFDAAFGVSRTETERNDRLANRIQTLERDLSLLSNAYASDDILQAENQELQRQLKAHGIEPFQDWPNKLPN